jgi:hypothetical protein
VTCSKAGERLLQSFCEEFDSLLLHKKYSMEEVHYIQHCDNESCDLGSVEFECPVCHQQNVRHDIVWWDSRAEIEQTGKFDLCCDECGEGLTITKENYDYLIDHR